MNTSASPSFFTPVGSTIAFIFLPITALVWAERCGARKSLDGSTFLLYFVFGFILFLIAGTQTARYYLGLPAWPSASALAMTTYLLVSIFNLSLIEKVELEWRTSDSAA